MKHRSVSIEDNFLFEYAYFNSKVITHVIIDFPR